MNYRKILQTLGNILILEAIMLLLPLIFALIYKEKTILSFIIPSLISGSVGTALHFIKPKRTSFFAKEGFVVVGLSWIVLSLVGCLPFLLSKTIPHFIDAFFETVSGFTTTGSSVLTGDTIDSLNTGYKSILFWRSFTHWIGGMGILVFILAILPNSEGQNIFILRAESTGPQVGKLVSKIRLTARILYIIYFAFTIIEIILLTISPDMNLFQAICYSMGTAGTGGFGIDGKSVGAYGSYVRIVIGIFMLLFGINFNIFYLILAGKIKRALKSEELWWYLGIVFCSVVGITLNIYLVEKKFQLLDAFFQVSSIITTTGYATTTFENWPMFSQIILSLLMFIGSCAGSTGGGIKVSRIVILLKTLKRELRKIIHPNSVSNIKFEGSTLNEGTVKAVTNYFSFLMLIFVSCILIVSLNGFDFTTTITSVAACLNNIGPGLGNVVGAGGSFTSFAWYSKLTLIVAMLIGRLEIYPILILLSYKTWTNK